jgi:hypothetical protein
VGATDIGIDRKTRGGNFTGTEKIGDAYDIRFAVIPHNMSIHNQRL